MLYQQKVDSIAIFVMGILGMVFVLFSTGAFKNLEADCPSATFRNSWTAIQVIGFCMVVACIGFFLCTLRGSCYDANITRAADIYFIVFGLFSMFLVGICSASLKAYDSLSDKEKKDCDSGNTNKNYMVVIIALSVISLLACAGLWVKDYIIAKRVEGGSE